MQRHSCERISRTIKIPLWIQQISPWRKMFYISAKLVGEQDEISNVDKIHWGKNIHGNICHWLVTKPLSIFNARRSTSSQILCCVLERSINIRSPTKLGRTGQNGSQLLKASETMTESMESRLNSSGTSSQDSQRCSSAVKSPMFNDISCGTKGNEKECLANAKDLSILAKKFGIGQWSFIGPGCEKKWYSVEENSPTRNLGSYRGKDVVGICWKWMSNFPCNNSIVQRSTQKQRTRKNCRHILLQIKSN